MKKDAGKTILSQIFAVCIVGVLCVRCLMADPVKFQPVLLQPGTPESVGMSTERLALIDGVVEEAIREGNVPGAVVLAARKGTIVFHKAYGHRAIVPAKEAMTLDTIFDMASLTKVMVTAPLVMQLAELGQVRLTDRVTKFLPKFAFGGKESIHLRHLLTHFSGLRPDLPEAMEWKGYDTTIHLACLETPIAAPGEKFIYSDIGFFLLGEIIRQVSQKPLEQCIREKILDPLGMKDTTYLPPKEWIPRIAPVEMRRGSMIRGEVHDYTADRMGGVAGHAGLFSTAGDTAIYAQTILNGGIYNGKRVLSPAAVRIMTSRQSPPENRDWRGYGWDIDTRYSSNRGDLFPSGSFGHTGFTGTSLWIDPFTESFLVILSSRLHPDGKGDTGPMRGQIANIVASAMTDVDKEVWASMSRKKNPSSPSVSFAGSDSDTPKPILLGIDTLREEGFAALKGKKIGLITNHTGVDRQGRSTLDILMAEKSLQVVALFSPEHGLYGIKDEAIQSGKDEKTGLPVHSLYGDTRKPTPEMLQGVDTLVFDIQDIGCRFYTYISTMGLAMEEAAKHHISFVVLDRPNYINGWSVDGPMADADKLSFIAYFPMPIRHGMTIGELAQMFRAEKKLDLDLKVIPMKGWTRQDYFRDTGLKWIHPSPNMRSETEAILYPGIGTLETTNLSVGRGTEKPFEWIGAPWINGVLLARTLNRRKVPGIRFEPQSLTPQSSVYANQLCHGVRIVLKNREAFPAVLCGYEIASALYRLYPKKFEIDKFLRLTVNQDSLDRLKKGESAKKIAESWKEGLQRFLRIREKYLIYR